PASSFSSEVRASESWRSSSAVLSCKSASRWLLTFPLYSACVFILASDLRWLEGASAGWLRRVPGPGDDHYGAGATASAPARSRRSGAACDAACRPGRCRKACSLLEHTYDPK